MRYDHKNVFRFPEYPLSRETNMDTDKGFKESDLLFIGSTRLA